MVVQTYTLDYSLFLDANSWTIRSVFPTPGPAVIFLWCSNRQGTALSPEFLATCNPFSLCRTSGKLLAVDHCLFLPVQSVVVEQQESTKSSTGRWEHSCSSYPLDPFLYLPAAGNLVAMNSFIMRVTVSTFLNLKNMYGQAASSSGNSYLQGEFAGEKLLLVSNPVFTF